MEFTMEFNGEKAAPSKALPVITLCKSRQMQLNADRSVSTPFKKEGSRSKKSSVTERRGQRRIKAAS